MCNALPGFRPIVIVYMHCCLQDNGGFCTKLSSEERRYARNHLDATSWEDDSLGYFSDIASSSIAARAELKSHIESVVPAATRTDAEVNLVVDKISEVSAVLFFYEDRVHSNAHSAVCSGVIVRPSIHLCIEHWFMFTTFY